MTKNCQQHGSLHQEKYPGPCRQSKRISHILSFLVFLLFIPFYNLTAADDQSESHEDNYSQGVQRGERLFYGLIKGKFEGNACGDCHNTVEIDTFNWNPNAWEIAHKYKEKSVEEFTKAVLNPTGETMSQMHETFSLNEAEVELIKEFLDHFEEVGLAKQKPVINKILLFFLLGAILTWIVIEVIFLKKVKRKWILGVLFIGALGWQIQLLLDAGISLGRQENYEPDQPVKFSHAVHVTDNKIDCKYCHHTVEHSKSAGFPEVNLCMNCHIIVREGTHSGRHEIGKVVQAYDNNMPIEWIRVHNLQDHVFFSHAQHVKVGKIDCQVCHGEIETMDRVKQVSDLSMGWCINCHRDTEVQFFDNGFYESYKALHKKMDSGEIERVTADMVGSTECSKCHY